MSTLQAGPELDAKVAHACGCQADPRPLELFGVTVPMLWSPSTDLNAAFEAAEKCGLFNSFCLGFSRGVWTIFEGGATPDVETCFASGDAPALAICAAILAVKGVSAKP